MKLQEFKFSYLTWEVEFGSIIFTNALGNDMIQCDAPHKMHPNFAKSPNSPKSIVLLIPLRDPNLLGALHVRNNLLWHPNVFGPICVGLLAHLDGHHLVILFFFNKYGVVAFLITLLV